jgi:CopG family nickel-responsive transcriptional regulator
MQLISDGNMSNDGRVRRFSISLPPNLVEEFDETWRSVQYENRSKAVHDAIRSFITDVQWMRRETGVVVGTILVLYYIDRPSLIERVALVQHRFRQVVRSVQQFYVEGNKIMEIIAVEGKVEEIKLLTQELMVMKGVKQVKPSLIAP